MLKRFSGITPGDFFKRNFSNNSFLSSSSGGDILITSPEVKRLISLGLNFSIALGCLSETTTIGLDLTKKESKTSKKTCKVLFLPTNFCISSINKQGLEKNEDLKPFRFRFSTEFTKPSVN